MTNHALASRVSLHASDLDGVRLIVPGRSVNEPIYDGLLASFARAGIRPNIVYETMQSQVGMAMVRQGVGLMLSAAYVFAEVPQGLVARPVDGFDRLDVHLFIRRDESRPLILDFADLAIEQAARLAADETGNESQPRLAPLIAASHETNWPARSPIEEQGAIAAFSTGTT